MPLLINGKPQIGDLAIIQMIPAFKGLTYLMLTRAPEGLREEFVTHRFPQPVREI